MIRIIVVLQISLVLFSCGQSKEKYSKYPPKWLIGEWRIFAPTVEEVKAVKESSNYQSAKFRDEFERAINLVVVISKGGSTNSYCIGYEKESTNPIEAFYLAIDEKAVKQSLVPDKELAEQMNYKPSILKLIKEDTLEITRFTGDRKDVGYFKRFKAK